MNLSALSEAVRFAAIGCLNTAIDFGLFWIAARYLGSPLVLANVAAWLVAFTFSYFANGRCTFGRDWVVLLNARYYLRLALGNLVSLTLATATLLAAACIWPLVVAKVLSIAVGFIVNFLVAKYMPVH